MSAAVGFAWTAICQDAYKAKPSFSREEARVQTSPTMGGPLQNGYGFGIVIDLILRPVALSLRGMRTVEAHYEP